MLRRNEPPHRVSNLPSGEDAWRRDPRDRLRGGLDRDEAPHRAPNLPSGEGAWAGDRRDRLRGGLDREEAPHRALNLPSGEGAWNDDRRDRLPGDITRDSRLRSWGNSNIALDRYQDRSRSGQPQAKDWTKPDAKVKAADPSVLPYSDPDVVLPTEDPTPHRMAGFSRDKTSFKTRGSIARGGEAVITRGQPRTSDLKTKMHAGKEKKRKTKALKKVNPDVFIPSTVSVGQLARLLNVRMGRCKYYVIALWLGF